MRINCYVGTFYQSRVNKKRAGWKGGKRGGEGRAKMGEAGKGAYGKEGETAKGGRGAYGIRRLCQDGKPALITGWLAALDITLNGLPLHLGRQDYY